MPRKRTVKRDGISEPIDRKGFIIQWTGFDGRRKRRTVKVASKEAARLALDAEKKKVEQARVFGMPLPTEDSFSAFAAEFLKLQENRISPHVVRGKLSRAEYIRQKGIVDKHLVPFFGAETKLATIRRSDVLRYINKRTGTVSDASIIKEVNTLKRLFTVAVDLEKIPANPALRAPLPKAPEGKTVYLTPEQWKAVFKSCYIAPTETDPNPKQWLQWAAGLAVALGTRRGELMHTRIPDIDLDAKQVLLRNTKSGKERVVFINDLAMQVFEAMGIRERKRRGQRNELFPDIDPAQLSMRFIRAARQAGVEGVSFHTLRHTFASHLKMAGADLDDIRRLLGHGDMRMVQRYAHVGKSHLEAAAARLNGVLTLPSTSDAEPSER
jgi:site-specific recombinase XerD